MKVGEKVPNFQFKATTGIQANLADYLGKWVILYFYPKDATPGCSIEARDFRDANAKFTEQNAVILGISRDSLKSHENFRCKQELPFELISDEDETICQLFDVIKIKSMYGKKLRGIERSTFLIDDQGYLQQEWRRVSVIGHVDEVEETLKSLQKDKK